MSITAQTGSVAFGLQSAKGTAATNWYKMKVNNIRMGAIVSQDTPPPEIGGTNNPTGAYKTTAAFAGSFAMAPRLEDVFGVLLYGATGQDTVTDNGDSTYTHKFTQKTGDATYIPWMSFRTKTPGTTQADERGEIGTDCKIAALELAFPQAGPVAANITTQGLLPTQADSTQVASWVDANTYETFESVPMSMKGSISFTGAPAINGSIKALGAKVSLVNGLTTPQQEQIMGQYYGEDLTTRTRALQIELTVKHTDAKLASYFFNGDATAATAAFDEAMQYAGIVIDVKSPGNISDTITVPWELKISADKIAWQQNGPIAMQGDELLVQQWVGIVIEADTGLPEDYYSIELTNTRATSYSTM